MQQKGLQFNWPFTCFYPLVEESMSKKILQAQNNPTNVYNTYTSLGGADSNPNAPKTETKQTVQLNLNYLKGDDDVISAYFTVKDST